MKTVAVLGGGPAGSMAAERLASAGMRVLLFDEKLAWEKPCGGGITYKAYDEYPFLIDNDTPKRVVHCSTIAAPGVGDVKMSLTHPLVIYSRMDLNRMLLERAESAGVAIEKTRVLGMERKDRGWRLRTKNGTAEADFCILATGARNPLREVGTELGAGDTMSTLGYFVPATQDQVDLQFLSNFAGYIWVFPRRGHLSVGIGGKNEPANAMRARLERYMDERGIAWKGAPFFSHLLPALNTPAWRNNRVSGEGWLAVGDAGGLADPITGEGLYYAIRSGDLASKVVLDDAHGIAAKAAAYRTILAREFATDLEFAAMLAKRFFMGNLLFRSVPERMVQIMRRSPRFRDVMQELFAGTQPYNSLKARLMKNLNGTIQEVLMNLFLNRVVADRPPVAS
jgi:geranylgeranyl reductase family protein